MFWRHDRLQGDQISPITICLMRWLRLHWRRFSWVCTSRKEYVSKSNELKNTTDSDEGDKLHTWSMSIFEPPELLKLYKNYQICPYTFTKWWHWRFRYKVGPSSISRTWNSYGNCPGRFLHVKIAGFRSASHCIGFVWSRNFSKKKWTAEPLQIEDFSKTS